MGVYGCVCVVYAVAVLSLSSRQQRHWGRIYLPSVLVPGVYVGG